MRRNSRLWQVEFLEGRQLLSVSSQGINGSWDIKGHSATPVVVVAPPVVTPPVATSHPGSAKLGWDLKIGHPM